MENNNINLSEMDRIFIPSDLDGNVTVEDLASYTDINVKFWRTVPENYCLVTKNIFTQVVDYKEGHGLKFINPLFTKTILVPLMDVTKGYNGLPVTTSDGIEIKTDIELVMRITDPAKYVVEGKYQINQLNSLVKRLLRVYVSTKGFENVIQEECKLNNFDPNREFAMFEQNYGIKIDRVIIEKVELPERLKKLYNDAAEAKERQKAQTIENQIQEEKAVSAAKIREIEAEAKAKEIKAIESAKTQAYIEKLTELVEKLKKQGISTGSIEKQIETLIMAEKGNAIFMAGGNTMAGNIASGVAAGVKYAKNNTGQVKNDDAKTETNVERLINVLDTYGSFVGNDSAYYENMKNMLKTDKSTIEKINRLSEQEYLNFINNVFGSIDFSNVDSNIRGKKKH